jgi:succinate dehydrogenase / fumarate reductase cytochrome b subunit
VVHLSAFWIPNRGSQLIEGRELDLFQRMADAFSNPLIVVIYILGCIALAWHLVHGFYSAFQTFGLTTHRYKGLIRSVGLAFAIIVPLIFASMPLWFYGGSQGWFDMTPSVFAHEMSFRF